ncbi:ATP-binding protein [Patescibacteria group bacterium]|nr:ATP-binding protein [Patescibacteria group bacterium]
MTLPFFKKKPVANQPSQPAPDRKSVSTTPISQSPITNQAVNRLQPTSPSSSVLDIIAPEKIEVDFNFVKISETYFRTFFIANYPRFVSASWLSPIIDFDSSQDLAMFIYPVESRDILSNLKRKIAEMEATIESDIKRGHVVDPAVQVALDDALALQEQLAKGAERFFQFGLYVTINAQSLDNLEKVSKQVESTLASLMLVSKKATLQMEDGFRTTQPLCVDKLLITRNMDTTSLATTFPFTSSELTANEGVMYGLNEHNGSLIIFDRFSLENANEVVLGKSGGGKSYLVKLEALRSLMFGASVIIIDPEEEYEPITRAVGGDYLSFSFSSQTHINPFDLAGTNDDPQENDLQYKIGFSLTRLIKLMVGTTTAEDDAIIHNALELTYKQKGITYDPTTHKKEPPILEDLYKVLVGMETPAAANLALRLEKFVKGSFGAIFNQRSNLKLDNPFTVFSFKNLEDQLRSLAIFIIVDFIWNSIKRDFKKRILIVDEAWYLMKDPSSAEFLWGFAKRARKYYLGLTTITQDIEDFLSSDLGKTIITNSSIQILMKQSPAAIDKLGEVFYLSEGEKSLLMSAGVGQGLFFAGSSHVAMRTIASPDEHKLITTNPLEKSSSTTAQPAGPTLAQPVTPPVPTTPPITPVSPASPTPEPGPA